MQYDTPSIENAHHDFIQAENFISTSERRWLSWIDQAEKLVGHSLDGDQDTDGYSLDFAYEVFEKGVTAKAFVASIRQ